MGTMDFAFRALVVAVAVAAFWAGLMGVTLSELQAGDASLLEHKLQAFGPLAAALAASRPAVALAGALLAAAWLYGAAPGEVIAYTITHHRWVLACFLMPVSFVFDGFWMLRSKLVRWMDPNWAIVAASLPTSMISQIASPLMMSTWSLGSPVVAGWVIFVVSMLSLA